MPKVIVGMSGGVDSSVTAYLLKEQGYEVEGLSFILWEARSRTDITTCCSHHVMEEISKNAHHIGIPHSIIDLRNDFINKVIEPFVNAYISGSTPNPCVLCNRFIKFPFLLKEAEKRGAEYISTGHYARVINTITGHRETEIRGCRNIGIQPFPDSAIPRFSHSYLKKGLDLKKDQSYILYVLTQNEIKRLILPLGNYRKDEVREIAQELNLPATKMAESQEICFIESGNYFKFIEGLSSATWKPGSIVDMTGKVIGTHKGIHGYTIGQRKGLGISSPEPLYVVKIDAMRNTVYVGPQEAAQRKEFFVKDLNWILPIWEEGETMPCPCRAFVKVRSMMKDEPATIFQVSDKTVQVVFDKSQWAPAPGQSAVFYNDDKLIGGGVII